MADFINITSELVRGIAPQRNDEGHKGTFGTAMLIAGSKFMTGALVLSCTAALRSGSGMVRAFSEETALDPVRINCPCALTSAYENSNALTIKSAVNYCKRAKSVGIGSGLDEGNKVNSGILQNMITYAKSLVIDAGALNIIASEKELFLPLLKERLDSDMAPAILTPHIGEFARLTNLDIKSMSEDELKSAVSGFATTNGVIIILKSSTIYIATPEGTNYVYAGNNSGMAKGGSGDVLMGLLTGLLSQDINPVAASVAATYFHQKAGLLAAADIGKRAMLPSDLTNYFGKAFEGCGW